jgi:hypothetical protein
MKGAFITHLGCGRAARRGDNRTAKPATLSSMIFPGEMYQASRFARCTTWEEEKNCKEYVKLRINISVSGFSQELAQSWVWI